MCGLVGVFGDNLQRKDAVALRHLLLFDATRGEHSTGVGVITKKNSVELYKELGDPYKFFEKYPKTFPKGILETVGVKAAIGHNRYATQGAIIAENAHPFLMGSVIGAHNGTVWQYSLNKFDGYKEFNIDSQIIYKHLSTHSIQDVWKEADGAMALTWWDQEKDTMNFARNKERPLYYAISKDLDKIYWASEDWMLWISLLKANIEIEGKIRTVSIDTHYSFSLDDKKKIEVKETKLDPFVRTYSTNYTGYTIGGAVKEGEFSADFFLTDFTPLQLDHSGEALSGFFSGMSSKLEPVRVAAAVITNAIRHLINKIENNECHETFTSDNCEWVYNKNTKEWIVFTYYSKISTKKKKSPKSETQSKTQTGTNVIPFSSGVSEPYLDGIRTSNFYGEWIDKDQFLEHVKNGCEKCHCEITWEMRNQIGWNNLNSCYCPKCEDEEWSRTEIGGLMVNKQRWEILIGGGCSQCGDKATEWKDRNLISWYYHGPDLAYTCACCSGKL